MDKISKQSFIALAACLVMIACESDNQDFVPESVDLKSANNGMIKSFGNTVIVQWNEALGLAIDNRMPPASEARIYAIVSLAVLADRQTDPLLGFQSWPQGTMPGEYRSTMPYTIANAVWPEHAVYAPNLGTFRPFGIATGDQFRVMPPLGVNTPEYAAELEEVKIPGSNTSTVKTQEEADLAVFYLSNISNLMNQVARSLAVQEGLDGWETARLLALTHITQFDAHLSSFEAIYLYNRWRPVTAIRMAENDGNDLTSGDPACIPLLSDLFPVLCGFSVHKTSTI